MKKVLCLAISLLMLFSFCFVNVYADEGKSKTETFMSSLKDGAGVKLSNPDVLIYVKDGSAYGKMNYNGTEINLYAEKDSVWAYIKLFNILPLKANVVEIINALNIDFDINALLDTLEVPEIPSDTLEYLTLTKAETVDGKYVETFSVDKDKVADIMYSYLSSQPEFQENSPFVNAQGEVDKDAVIAYCDANEASLPQYTLIKQCGGTVTFTDDSGKTITDCNLVYPNNDMTDVNTLTLNDALSGSDVRIEYVTIDLSGMSMRKPFAINITWLVKLIISKFIGA